jgi:hypothetical protein
MPDFKCVACRTRSRRVGDLPHSVADPCPGCGSPLVLVGELAEVVGFRSVTTADRVVGSPVADFTTRRDARDAPLRYDAVDAQRWVDDGGSAVVAVALPTSDRRLLPNAGGSGENGTP